MYNSINNKMKTIYILKLENNKFYVGQTNNLHKRLNQHKNNYGSAWSQKYNFIELIDSFPSKSDFDEDYYVKIYMDKYGIDNVRGGSYSQIILPDYQIKALTKEFNSKNNNCFRCGRNSHFVQDCYAKTDINGKRLASSFDDDLSDNVSDTSSEYDILTDVVNMGSSIFNYFKKKIKI
jgi:hypothetical protein